MNSFPIQQHILSICRELKVEVDRCSQRQKAKIAEQPLYRKIARFACNLFMTFGLVAGILCIPVAALTVSASLLGVGTGSLLVSATAYYLRDLFSALTLQEQKLMQRLRASLPLTFLELDKPLPGPEFLELKRKDLSLFEANSHSLQTLRTASLLFESMQHAIACQAASQQKAKEAMESLEASTLASDPLLYSKMKHLAQQLKEQNAPQFIQKEIGKKLFFKLIDLDHFRK